MAFNGRKFLAAALLGSSALIAPSMVLADVPAPSFITPDRNGVDLTTGLPWVAMEEGGIGSGPGRIAMQRIYAEGAGFVDNWTGGLYSAWVGTQQKMFLQWAGISDTFSGSGTTWTTDKADGGKLTYNSTTGNWIYTSRDGTVFVFPETEGEKTPNCPGAVPKSCRVPVEITHPSGLKFYFSWDTEYICVDRPGEPCWKEYIYHRLLGVASSAGYGFTVTYQSNQASAGMPLTDPWFIRSAVAFNNTANPPSPKPTISYLQGTSSVSVTDPAGRTTVFSLDTSGRLTGIKRPGSASNNVSYTYGTGGTVISATKDGVTDSYSLSGTTMTVTDPLSNQIVVVTDSSTGRPASYRNALLKTWGYQYDSNARLTRLTAPEGNYTQYTYDSRGNVTTTTNVAKVGSGLANIVTSAGYDTTCTNVVKCNKPNSTTDARGNVTDYTYDSTHGGVLTVTQPAPATGAVRPQTRYTYSQVTSAYGDLVYMPTTVAACQTAASCTNGADESQIVLAYNSNLLPTSSTRKNGTGTVTATNAFAYDPRGNVLTVDGPLSGTADTTAFKYDSADQTVGAISPDPDGAASLKNRAVRLTYRPDGQVSKQEAGTTVGQTDAAWAAFVPLQTVDITFDSNSRPVTSKLSASGTNYALTQTSYDALGRTDCTAVRMNIAAYASLPPSACTLGTEGSVGPDRISQTVYDAAGQVIQNKVAVGTTDAATESTLTYSNDGMLATLKDGENNLTTFEYDGFDRLSKTRFPNPTKGSGTSSTTDYEQLTYDANSNVTSRRVRNGNSIGFSYDNLNRPTLKDLPAAELDVSYTYDNLNRLTLAATSAMSVSFGYDALNRKTTETGPHGTLSFGYDAAGRRTATNYPGGTLSATYSYLTTGELDTISQGATVLADYSYDDLGNRTGVSFANGSSQAFTYDPVSRLASLTNELAGTSNDLTKTYSYNPASQIVQESRTNDAYAFVQSNVTETGTSNGLNQLTQYAGRTVTHETRGNLNGYGSDIYTYSNENLMTGSVVGGVGTGLKSDPLLRLYEVASGPVSRFAYDGIDAVAEHDSLNALQRRWVFDPTTDQPVIWYEGTGTAATDRRYLSQDERGSVISVSDSTGASLGINTYDEYGNPGAGNLGRYGYTGQAWLPTAKLWYLNARMYSPAIGGRFMQTDPIGMTGGINLYAYAGNDPINRADPLGLTQDVDPADIFVTACENGGTIGVNGSCSGTDMMPTSVTFGDTGVRVPRGDKCGSGECTVTVTGRRALHSISLLLVDFGDWAQNRLCQGLSVLGDLNLNLSADIQGYGGLGGAAGASASIDAKGNTSFNIYYGWGAGFGIIAGAGVSLSKPGPAPGITRINHMQGGIGVGAGGVSGTYSKEEGGSGSAGLSVGPKLGYAFGSVTGRSETTSGGNICR